MSAEHVRRLTHALTRPETALAAAEALRGHLDAPGAVEGLVQFVHAPHTGTDVQVSSLDNGSYAGSYVGARRIT